VVLRREDTRHEAEAQLLAQLRGQHPDIAEAIELTQDFAYLVRQRQGEHLDAWMARVAQSAIVALQRFAKGLADDYDAVKAGLTLPWSTGPVEGHITRLKLLKRQMFGRARLALLQQRCVLAPRPGPGRVQRRQVLAEVLAQPVAA
jgi:transposase